MFDSVMGIVSVNHDGTATVFSDSMGFGIRFETSDSINKFNNDEANIYLFTKVTQQTGTFRHFGFATLQERDLFHLLKTGWANLIAAGKGIWLHGITSPLSKSLAWSMPARLVDTVRRTT